MGELHRVVAISDNITLGADLLPAGLHADSNLFFYRHPPFGHTGNFCRGH